MITVDGVALQDHAWNITTTGSRMAAAAPRGSNLEVAGADGALWSPNKPLAELQFELSMWVVGADEDGSMPSGSGARAAVRDRVDELLGLLWRQDRLVELVDTDRARRCWVEVLQPFNPTTMAGATRAEFAVECNAPAGCWEDVDPVTTGEVNLGSGNSVTLDGLGGGNLPPAVTSIRLAPPGRNLVVTTEQGARLEFQGDIPAGGVTINPVAGTAYPSADPYASVMGQVRWSPGPLMLPLTTGAADPVVQVGAETTTTDSTIEIVGRRRWRSA